MTEYVKKHGLLGRKEKFYRSTVLEWLKKNIDSKITEDLVKEYLDYWSLVGTFFVYSDPYVSLSSNTRYQLTSEIGESFPKLVQSNASTVSITAGIPSSTVLVSVSSLMSLTLQNYQS